MKHLTILKPRHLQHGDLIGIIDPASAAISPDKIEHGVRYLEHLGYRIKLGKYINERDGYLAGSDENRVHDFHAMFEDKEVKAIFLLRGGYGSPRILDRINYDIVNQNPKIFVGYSDITALQLAILDNASLVSFAGPMVGVEMANEIDPFTENIFWEMITKPKENTLLQNPIGQSISVIKDGKAEGVLLGGNMTMLLSLHGTAYFPSFTNSILFLEEIGEQPYRIDRMFAQLKMSGVLQSVSGIILGQFTECEPKPDVPSLTLDRIFEDYLKNLEIPVVSNFAHGHVAKSITVPFGTHCQLDTSLNGIELLESPVI